MCPETRSWRNSLNDFPCTEARMTPCSSLHCFLAWRGGEHFLSSSHQEFPCSPLKTVMKDVPEALWGHQQVLSPSWMGSMRSCEFAWAELSTVTPALVLTHCSCLFSSLYLLTWTLEIRLLKRQWRLQVLCLLSLNHPAKQLPIFLVQPLTLGRQTEGNGLEQSEEYVTFSPSSIKKSNRSSKGLLWSYKWETGVYFLFPLQSPSRTFITSNTAGKKSSQSSSWQQWKSPNLRTWQWLMPSQISYKPNKIWYQWIVLFSWKQSVYT